MRRWQPMGWWIVLRHEARRKSRGALAHGTLRKDTLRERRQVHFLIIAVFAPRILVVSRTRTRIGIVEDIAIAPALHGIVFIARRCVRHLGRCQCWHSGARRIGGRGRCAQLLAGLARTGVSWTFEQVLRQLREHRSEHAKVGRARARALPWCTLMALMHLGRSA